MILKIIVNLFSVAVIVFGVFLFTEKRTAKREIAGAIISIAGALLFAFTLLLLFVKNFFG